MKAAHKYVLYGIVALVQACIDPISFETESGEDRLVFYGNLTQLCENHIFTITKTAEFGKPVTPVSGASVIIMDDQGSSAEYLEINPGLYQLTPDKMMGIPGRSYHIEITLSNGESYFTIPQVMPEPIEVDSIYFEFNQRPELSGSGVLVDKTFIDVFIDTPVENSSGGPSYIRWVVDEVYSFVDRACGPFDLAETCYFMDPIEDAEVLLFKNEVPGQKYLRGLKVRSRLLVPFDEFTARHYFIVHQYTISEDQSDYWEKIDAVANQTGNLFDVQPAAVVGNIIEYNNEQTLALGYFGVNGESLIRTFTTPFLIRPNPVFDCNDASFFNNHPSECCTCQTKNGILIERPEYWDED